MYLKSKCLFSISHNIHFSNSDQDEEDEQLNMAAKALNDFDELCEQVTIFETEAFETKKRINLMDKDS